MRQVGMGLLVRKAVDRTVLVLFKPFKLKKWLSLLFIALLAGSLGGGNANFNNNVYSL